MAQSSKTVAIVGQGYVGLPLAMAAVRAGWTVIGVENSQQKYQTISSGISPVEDVPSVDIQDALSAGTYLITTESSQVRQASVVILSVPTPLDDKHEPDLSILREAVLSIAPYVETGTLVINESTSYPGTLRNFIAPLIDANKSENTSTVHLAVAPERVNPGDEKWNQKNTPRLLAGIDEISTDRAHEFYSSICDNVVLVTQPEIAETAKLLENTFRLVNIALVNQLAQLCADQGINVHEVIDAAATKPYGYMRFTPSVGVGGHCIPVDPMYLTWWAEQNGASATLVTKSDEINRAMPIYVAKRAIDMLPAGSSKRLLIMGVAYKPGVRDVRETPASSLRDELLAQGCEVAWIDPLVHEWDGTAPVDPSWHCDVAIVATAQPGLPVADLVTRNVPILDCTGAYKDLSGVVRL